MSSMLQGAGRAWFPQPRDGTKKLMLAASPPSRCRIVGGSATHAGRALLQDSSSARWGTVEQREHSRSNDICKWLDGGPEREQPLYSSGNHWLTPTLNPDGMPFTCTLRPLSHDAYRLWKRYGWLEASASRLRIFASFESFLSPLAHLLHRRLAHSSL